MGAIPYAISVHHFVSTVGADAGFAAIIGLAILILLFFSQARETSSLRRRADESEEQVRDLEFQLSQLSRGVSQPAPAAPAVAPAPASVQRTMAPGAAAGAAVGAAAAGAAAGAVASRSVRPASPGTPAAPAGVGAPAMSSATRLIPTGGEDPISIRATGDAEATGAATSGAAPPTASGGGVVAPTGPPPSTAAGGANGGAAGRVPPPSAAAGAAIGAAASDRPPQQPQRAARPAAARPPVQSSRRAAPAERPSRARGAALVAAGVIAVAAIVVALLVLTSGGTSSTHASSASQISNAGTGKHHSGGHPAALKPSAVMVDVLNGTATPNLAHDITQKLANAGYKTGTPATATDQTQTATTVGFLQGHRKAALLVAHSLDLGKASVQPVAQANEAVACPQTSSCTAQVIVTVGADLASAAGTATTSAAST